MLFEHILCTERYYFELSFSCVVSSFSLSVSPAYSVSLLLSFPLNLCSVFCFHLASARYIFKSLILNRDQPKWQHLVAADIMRTSPGTPGFIPCARKLKCSCSSKNSRTKSKRQPIFMYDGFDQTAAKSTSLMPLQHTFTKNESGVSLLADTHLNRMV